MIRRAGGGGDHMDECEWACVQGKCSGPLDPALFWLEGAGLWPLAPQQCVIVADRQLFTLIRPELYGADEDTGVEVPYFWIDNLYVRLRRTRRTPPWLKLVNFSGYRGRGWLTRTVVQGDGLKYETHTERALWAGEMVTRFYAQGTGLADQPPCEAMQHRRNAGHGSLSKDPKSLRCPS